MLLINCCLPLVRRACMSRVRDIGSKSRRIICSEGPWLTQLTWLCWERGMALAKKVLFQMCFLFVLNNGPFNKGFKAAKDAHDIFIMYRGNFEVNISIVEPFTSGSFSCDHISICSTNVTSKVCCFKSLIKQKKDVKMAQFSLLDILFGWSENNLIKQYLYLQKEAKLTQTFDYKSKYDIAYKANCQKSIYFHI